MSILTNYDKAMVALVINNAIELGASSIYKNVGTTSAGKVDDVTMTKSAIVDSLSARLQSKIKNKRGAE